MGEPSTRGGELSEDEIWRSPQVVQLSRPGVDIAEQRLFFEQIQAKDGRPYDLERVMRWMRRAKPRPDDGASVPLKRADRPAAVAPTAFDHAGRLDGINPADLERFYGTAAP